MRGLKQNLLGIFLATFFLWLVFFLVNGLPNSSLVGPDISKDCSWKSVALDANLDGIFSYSDAPIWFTSIFVGFQKFLVANLYDTSIGQFIELKKNACTSFKAQAISFVTLLAIFLLISKATLSAMNTLIAKIKSLQQKNSLTSEISYRVSSRNFVEAIWSLHFKLVLIALVAIVIGLNLHFLKNIKPINEKRIAIKNDSGKNKVIEPSIGTNKNDEALNEDAKKNINPTTEIPKSEIRTNALSVPTADKYEELILEFVNRERSTGATCGDKYFQPATPLRKNKKLDDAALAHAKDMAISDYFSHTSKNGDLLENRVSKHNYSWSTIGENIAKGQKTSSQVVNAWMKSPGHCSNIMNPTFTELGVGRDDNLRKEYIWVQVFGRGK